MHTFQYLASQDILTAVSHRNNFSRELDFYPKFPYKLPLSMFVLLLVVRRLPFVAFPNVVLTPFSTQEGKKYNLDFKKTS
jgi:hypothetical protein